MKLLTVITLMVLVSTASSSCYSGRWIADEREGPWKTDCDREGDETVCYHKVEYTDEGRYLEQWGCGICPDGDNDHHCENCYYHYCNYEGDASGAGQIVLSTLSVLVPVALLY